MILNRWGCKVETMPTPCQRYYECTSCKALLKPLKVDSCVYCSYGTIKSLLIQKRDDLLFQKQIMKIPY
ncbi:MULTISPECIES: GDCCVxC domain-containing (seleno)protein [Pseudoalteromonas]|uniref:GDCCVxC domain-containing (seleno)protein n=2 Tax=Pseudoalteromonas TaxID=53246 RepID=UPI00123128D2|nr:MULTISPECIES: GDCCVxC domain-containing (seleno)protein [Pseudoalteromonas]